MTMCVSRIVTHLLPEDAYTIVEFLDKSGEMLMQTYGNEITNMLQEAEKHDALVDYGDDEVF